MNGRLAWCAVMAAEVTAALVLTVILLVGCGPGQRDDEWRSLTEARDQARPVLGCVDLYCESVDYQEADGWHRRSLCQCERRLPGDRILACPERIAEPCFYFGAEAAPQ